MPYSASPDNLAEFQKQLIGCWQNLPFGSDGIGGDKNPLSYNIMPLPQTDGAPEHYILKNFKYTERLRFNDGNDAATLAIAAVAPNRGGLVTQNCRAVFYEQQVRFAEGPQGPGGAQAGDKKHGDVVHVENGAWLWLPRFGQPPGPFPANINADPVTEDLDQPVHINIAKQMSIPHGNSILALGSFDTVRGRSAHGKCMRTSSPTLPGRPVIPDGSTPYPMPADAAGHYPHPVSTLNACHVYSTLKNHPNDFQNPHPDLTRFPNHPLQEAVEIIGPDHYMHWSVTTEPFVATLPLDKVQGHVVNIPFEQRVSDVIGYSAEYWMLFKDEKRYLAYTQTIPMVLTIKGTKYVFPHVTCNTVTYTGSAMKDGCCAPLE
jgi:hypothetical protein